MGHRKVQVKVPNKSTFLEALVDTDIFSLLKTKKFHLRGTRPHVSLWLDGKEIYLSRFIIQAKKNQTVDHKNRDILDNRKVNLRIVSSQENSVNKTISKRNKSGFKGVSFQRNTGKWRAEISKNRKTFVLGLFSDKRKAALAYNRMAKKLHGKFIKLNSL